MTHDVNKLNWAGATAAVEKAGSILLVTHMNPDGDAIGSLVALALALRERGKQVDAGKKRDPVDIVALLATYEFGRFMYAATEMGGQQT